MQKVIEAWVAAIVSLLLKAAILMFAWAAVANTFDLPSLSYGAAIALILVVAMLIPVRTQKEPEVKVLPLKVEGANVTSDEVSRLLREMRN